MAFGHLSDQSFHDELKVRPKDTTQSGDLVHSKAKVLDMSVRRFDTKYAVADVMLSWRGDKNEVRGQIGELNSRDYTPQESSKKNNATQSPMHTGNYGGAMGGADNAEKSWDL